MSDEIDLIWSWKIEWSIFLDQKLFEDDISFIFDRFASMKCLSITKNFANAKLDENLITRAAYQLTTILQPIYNVAYVLQYLYWTDSWIVRSKHFAAISI